ncbi:MAG: glycoside hydrolase family 130 protein [Fimbriimonas sp.]
MANMLLPNPLPDWALGGFVRPPGVNPAISPIGETKFLDPMSGKDVGWEASDTFNPGSVERDGKVVVLYRAEDHLEEGIGRRTSRLGLAESSDGLRFVRAKAPVLFPAEDDQKEAEWPGGCEDPRVVVTEDGTYAVFYTQWNRRRAQLAVATSRDLVHWTKYGSIFRNSDYHPDYYKSASPITQVVKGRQVLVRIGGKYWMYWGEDGVRAATSTNLVDWTPVRDSDGSVKILAAPRRGRFDSVLTECGPPAVLTDRGIVLLYNGKNATGEEGDSRFAAGAYCAGQLLLSKDDPTRLLGRLDDPFFRPMEPFEKSGQYVAGTVFVEGLTWFKEKWFLYYGCADSRVGVAVFDPKNPGPGDPLPK